MGILTSFWTRADGYYLDRDFIYLNPSEQNVYDFTLANDDAAVRAALKKLSIGYIVLDSTVLSQFSDNSSWAKIEGFERFKAGVAALNNYCLNNGVVIYSDKIYSVYKI